MTALSGAHGPAGHRYRGSVWCRRRSDAGWPMEIRKQSPWTNSSLVPRAIAILTPKKCMGLIGYCRSARGSSARRFTVGSKVKPLREPSPFCECGGTDAAPGNHRDRDAGRDRLGRRPGRTYLGDLPRLYHWGLGCVAASRRRPWGAQLIISLSPTRGMLSRFINVDRRSGWAMARFLLLPAEKHWQGQEEL